MRKKQITLTLIVILCLSTVAMTGCGKDSEEINGNVDVNKYIMDLSLDVNAKTLSGQVIMDLTNNSGGDINQVCIRNYAASILEKRGKGKSQIRSVKMAGESLDFDTEKDSSVVYVDLGDKVIASGESLAIKVDYLTDVPKTNDRFGYRGDKKGQLFLLSFCFPQLAMYEDGQWNENPYIDGGESTFNKVTDYDITLTAPENYMIAASGDEETNGKVTTINAKDMRDMSIVASDYMEVETDTVAGVEINNYTLKYENSDKTNELTMAATKDSVELFTDRFGKYPYEELDVIQCFMEGGMEYPGMIFIGLWDMAPEEYYYNINERTSYVYLCELIAHEVGHEWFYGAVGNDQYEEPWLDEGFSEFCQMLYSLEKPDSLKRGIEKEIEAGAEESGNILWKSEKMVEEMNVPRDSEKKDIAINKPVDWYEKNNSDYDFQVYSNGAAFLYELKKSMGEEKFFDAMKEYYKTYCLKIATGEDFLGIIKDFDDSEKTQKVIDKYIK